MHLDRVQWRVREISEARHEIQNPTSADKVIDLGARLRLGPKTQVLDIASGRGGPALLLAERFGCRVTGIELREVFFAAAVQRADARGLGDLVRFVHADANDVPLEPESYDVALCLGATFVYGGLEGTLGRLSPVARTHVVVGEPYRRRDGIDLPTLAEVVDRFEAAGLAPVAVIAASEDDWDRYETQHWQAMEEWLAANPTDPDAAELRALYLDYRQRYLEGRDAVGWSIVAGAKTRA